MYRRHRGDMIEVYKIMTGKYDPDAVPKLERRCDNVSRIGERRGHSKQIFIRRAKHDFRKHSFTHRVGPVWNSLPEEVVEAISVDEFKVELDKHWEDQPMKYNYMESVVLNR